VHDIARMTNIMIGIGVVVVVVVEEIAVNEISHLAAY
jgi:hypothetical protein